MNKTIKNLGLIILKFKLMVIGKASLIGSIFYYIDSIFFLQKQYLQKIIIHFYFPKRMLN